MYALEKLVYGEISLWCPPSEVRVNVIHTAIMHIYRLFIVLILCSRLSHRSVEMNTYLVDFTLSYFNTINTTKVIGQFYLIA